MPDLPEAELLSDLPQMEGKSEQAGAGSSGKAAAVRVAFMPFNRENQYWQKLADHLETYNVTVEEWRMLKGLPGRILRREQLHDVLHMHWMPRFEFNGPGIRRLPSFFLHMLALWLLGHRMVWTAHDLAHPEAVWRWADRWLTILITPFLSRIIVHSESAKETVSREFKIWRRSKVVVIPHGNYIDSYPNTVSREDARKELGLDPQATVFLLLGHIRPYKGVDALIDAFQHLPGHDRELLIVGKPMDAETLPTLDRLISDRERIHVHAGFVPDVKIQVYLNAADVMVIPYRQGLTSGAVVLGMSFGRACVAAALGCIPDMLDAEGGFLFNPAKPGDLERALANAMQARERLPAMGAHNLERARCWDWNGIARATAVVYGEVLGRNAPAA